MNNFRYKFEPDVLIKILFLWSVFEKLKLLQRMYGLSTFLKANISLNITPKELKIFSDYLFHTLLSLPSLIYM